jgi:hypothetical protein
MTMKNTLARSFVVSIVLLCGGALALGYSAEKESRSKALNPATLEKLASARSVEQAVLREAATKVRASKTPLASVEVPVVVVTSTLPGPCAQICVGSGVNRACSNVFCESTQ